MKYSELIELYKSGSLEENVKQEIEEEIEKHRAISDYIADELEQDNEWNWSIEGRTAREKRREEDIREEEEFRRKIIKAIRKIFIKTGVVIMAIVLCIVLFLIYGLSPLIKSFYYDPSKTVWGSSGRYEGNQISLDWSVYSEVLLPGDKRSLVSVEDRGYGKYDIVVYRTTIYSSGHFMHDLVGVVDKGKITLYDTGKTAMNHTGSGYAESADKFAYYDIDVKKPITEQEDSGMRFWWGGNREEATQKLYELEENKRYKAYVTFDSIMSFDEMKKIMDDENEEFVCLWVGVYTENLSDTVTSNDYLIGYAEDASGVVIEGWDEDRYPSLNLWNDSAGGNYQDVEQKLEDEEWCREHMISMLQYMLDNPALQEVFGIYEDSISYYLEEIKKNGLSYYGCVVTGTKEALLKLNDRDGIYGIYVEEWD